MTDTAARLMLAVAVVAMAAALVGCGGSGDPDTDRVNRLQKQGNAAALEQEVEKADTRVACLAVRALGRMGPQAQPQIEKALKSQYAEVRQEAALVYPRAVRGTAAPPLASAARTDGEPNVRAAAVTALGHMAAVDEIETLLAAVEDPDPLVRRRASEAIARIMGRIYDFSGTPQQRHEAAALVRERWRVEAQPLRDYHQKRLAPKSK